MADFWGFIKTICAPKKRWFFGARLISLYATHCNALGDFLQYVFINKEIPANAGISLLFTQSQFLNQYIIFHRVTFFDIRQ